MISTIEELSEAVEGEVITSAEIHDDGFHLNLRNGQTLFVVGALAVCLLDPQKVLQ